MTTKGKAWQYVAADELRTNPHPRDIVPAPLGWGYAMDAGERVKAASTSTHTAWRIESRDGPQ